MKDTSNKTQEIYHNMLMSKSNEDRFFMGISMFNSVRQIILSSFPVNTSESQKKIMLFNRFYSNDFSETAKQIILRHFQKKR